MDPKSLFYNIDYIDYDAVATKSTLNSHEDFFKILMRKNKKELAATLLNYSHVCNNDKSTGTTLEAAIAQVMGATVDRDKKHGYDSSYSNGNTLEIKPENVYGPIWTGKEYIPSNSKRLSMLGKYNDFTWHAVIRYISGTNTNSNDTQKYLTEIIGFIDNYYVDQDYKIYMKVACSVLGKKVDEIRKDKNWWGLIKSHINDPTITGISDIKAEWDRIVKKIRILRGSIKPTLWNKYHVSGGSVGGKLVYVARIDFPVVYERLFDRLLEYCPPEKRFRSTRARCQIDFNYKCLDSSNIHCVKWVYVDPELYRFKKCFPKDLWDIILFCNPGLKDVSSIEPNVNKFEGLFIYE